MRRAIFIAVLILSALLTGCSEDPASQPDEPIVTTATSSGPVDQAPVTIEPCAEDCSGQEVNTNGCDANPNTIGPARQVRLGNVSGKLELRLSDPSKCVNIVWARFSPYAETTGDWVVSLKVPGQPKEDQKSVAGDPTTEGYTEGIFANGKTVEYCVAELGGRKECYTAKV